eukprot:TRINITY_DN8364_c0_g1_i2.p1 TRINITY_DN8364_c0_g1~~TRINITY_DN8364_c0_g1_i2.p1  ORF type:complete len:250 (-),score=33.29 TRINITY_DN8364_c0_g1_i2:455-1204(-)
MVAGHLGKVSAKEVLQEIRCLVLSSDLQHAMDMLDNLIGSAAVEKPLLDASDWAILRKSKHLVRSVTTAELADRVTEEEPRHQQVQEDAASEQAAARESLLSLFGFRNELFDSQRKGRKVVATRRVHSCSGAPLPQERTTSKETPSVTTVFRVSDVDYDFFSCGHMFTFARCTKVNSETVSGAPCEDMPDGRLLLERSPRRPSTLPSPTPTRRPPKCNIFSAWRSTPASKHVADLCTRKTGPESSHKWF